MIPIELQVEGMLVNGVTHSRDEEHDNGGILVIVSTDRDRSTALNLAKVTLTTFHEFVHAVLLMIHAPYIFQYRFDHLTQKIRYPA